MRLTNKEEKYRAAVNLSWSATPSTCSYKSSWHSLTTHATHKRSTDYNLEEALISTNLIVTFLVKLSLTLTSKQIPSLICLHTHVHV